MLLESFQGDDKVDEKQSENRMEMASLGLFPDSEGNLQIPDITVNIISVTDKKKLVERLFDLSTGIAQKHMSFNPLCQDEYIELFKKVEKEKKDKMTDVNKE